MAEKEETLTKLKADMEQALAEKNKAIEEKDRTIEELKQEIEEVKKQLVVKNEQQTETDTGVVINEDGHGMTVKEADQWIADNADKFTAEFE